jgi:hypothetical protein
LREIHHDAAGLLRMNKIKIEPDQGFAETFDILNGWLQSRTHPELIFCYLESYDK